MAFTSGSVFFAGAVVRIAAWAVWLVCLPGLAWSSAHCDLGKQSAQAAPETEQFAFMVGDHDVTLHAWTGDGWTPPRPLNARWRGWYGLEGLAIYDEWVDPQPETGGVGVNVRLYDPDAKIWKMMWISTAGNQVQDLRAEVRDGVLTMWQVYPERAGWKAEFEMLGEDRWARVDFLQDDSGQWTPRYRLVATRQPCAPDQSASATSLSRVDASAG